MKRRPSADEDMVAAGVECRGFPLGQDEKLALARLVYETRGGRDQHLHDADDMPSCGCSDTDECGHDADEGTSNSESESDEDDDLDETLLLLSLHQEFAAWSNEAGETSAPGIKRRRRHGPVKPVRTAEQRFFDV